MSRFEPLSERGELEEAIHAVARVLGSRVFIDGEEVREFELEAARFLGVAGAVGVASGSDAITIGLRAALRDQCAGKLVIVPALTFVATAEAVIRAGLQPVFADVEDHSFLISARTVAPLLCDSTVAIVPVSLYGRPADIEELRLAAPGLAIVEDACQAFGARSDVGAFAGTKAEAGAFSFFPSKPLGGFGDGGLVSSNDPEILATARAIGRHGCLSPNHPTMNGLNSRLDALQAALLRIQLPKASRRRERRRRIAEQYAALLADCDGVVVPEGVVGHAWHLYTVRVLHGRRDRVEARMKAFGIDVKVQYPVPLHRLPCFAGGGNAPIADRLCGEILSLPIHSAMSDQDIEFVAGNVRTALSET